eukprot:GHVS01053600.1.p1 GENE.GHVS01053600.1~~GHVS01053600.1.p1  ORF type:complete len:1739 (-),score=232.38 GHVS01053600.1:433-5649(-)
MLCLNLPARNSNVDFSEHGYEMIELVGKGQFGRAYKVRRMADDFTMLAKAIDLTSLEEKDKTLSMQEAELMKGLDHPNVVKCYESFIHNDTFLVIIMEYCEGGDLSNVLEAYRNENKVLPECELIQWLVQLCEGLKYIHERKILHRDLKPSNILLDINSNIKIGDFGISRVMNATLALAVTAVGTPQYMSPEMCENKPYTFKGDVWALGCVLYEIACLRNAFVGGSFLGLVWNIAFKPIEPLPSHFSKELCQLLYRMLSKDPNKRPLTAEVLADPAVQVHELSSSTPSPTALPSSSLLLPGRRFSDGTDVAAGRSSRRHSRALSFLPLTEDFTDVVLGRMRAGIVEKGINAEEALRGSFCASKKTIAKFHHGTAGVLENIDEEQSEDDSEDGSSSPRQLAPTFIDEAPEDEQQFKEAIMNSEWLGNFAAKYELGISEAEVTFLHSFMENQSDDMKLTVGTLLDAITNEPEASEYQRSLHWACEVVQSEMASGARTQNMSLIEAFSQFDRNREKLVSRQHFRTVMHLYFPKMSSAQLDKMYQLAEKDFGGHVKYLHFMQSINQATTCRGSSRSSSVSSFGEMSPKHTGGPSAPTGDELFSSPSSPSPPSSRSRVSSSVTQIHSPVASLAQRSDVPVRQDAALQHPSAQQRQLRDLNYWQHLRQQQLCSQQLLSPYQQQSVVSGNLTSFQAHEYGPISPRAVPTVAFSSSQSSPREAPLYGVPVETGLRQRAADTSLFIHGLVAPSQETARERALLSTTSGSDSAATPMASAQSSPQSGGVPNSLDTRRQTPTDMRSPSSSPSSSRSTSRCPPPIDDPDIDRFVSLASISSTAVLQNSGSASNIYSSHHQQPFSPSASHFHSATHLPLAELAMHLGTNSPTAMSSTWSAHPAEQSPLSESPIHTSASFFSATDEPRACEFTDSGGRTETSSIEPFSTSEKPIIPMATLPVSLSLPRSQGIENRFPFQKGCFSAIQSPSSDIASASCASTVTPASTRYSPTTLDGTAHSLLDDCPTTIASAAMPMDLSPLAPASPLCSSSPYSISPPTYQRSLTASPRQGQRTAGDCATTPNTSDTSASLGLPPSSIFLQPLHDQNQQLQATTLHVHEAPPFVDSMTSAQSRRRMSRSRIKQMATALFDRTLDSGILLASEFSSASDSSHECNGGNQPADPRLQQRRRTITGGRSVGSDSMWALEARKESVQVMQQLVHYLQLERVASCRNVTENSSSSKGLVTQHRKATDAAASEASRSVLLAFHAQSAAAASKACDEDADAEDIHEAGEFAESMSTAQDIVAELISELHMQRDAIDCMAGMNEPPSQSAVEAIHGTNRGHSKPEGYTMGTDASKTVGASNAAGGASTSRAKMKSSWAGRYAATAEFFSSRIMEIITWCSSMVRTALPDTTEAETYRHLSLLKEQVSRECAFVASMGESYSLRSDWEAARIFMELVGARKFQGGVIQKAPSEELEALAQLTAMEDALWEGGEAISMREWFNISGQALEAFERSLERALVKTIQKAKQGQYVGSSDAVEVYEWTNPTPENATLEENNIFDHVKASAMGTPKIKVERRSSVSGPISVTRRCSEQNAEEEAPSLCHAMQNKSRIAASSRAAPSGSGNHASCREQWMEDPHNFSSPLHSSDASTPSVSVQTPEGLSMPVQFGMMISDSSPDSKKRIHSKRGSPKAKRVTEEQHVEPRHGAGRPAARSDGRLVEAASELGNARGCERRRRSSAVAFVDDFRNQKA